MSVHFLSDNGEVLIRCKNGAISKSCWHSDHLFKILSATWMAVSSCYQPQISPISGLLWLLVDSYYLIQHQSFCPAEPKKRTTCFKVKTATQFCTGRREAAEKRQWPNALTWLFLAFLFNLFNSLDRLRHKGEKHTLFYKVTVVSLCQHLPPDLAFLHNHGIACLSLITLSG